MTDDGQTSFHGDIDDKIRDWLRSLPMCLKCSAVHEEPRPVSSVWVRRLAQLGRYMVIIRCHGDVSTVWLDLDGNLSNHPEGGDTETSRQLSAGPPPKLLGK